jgi:hypothetical protein
MPLLQKVEIPLHYQIFDEEIVILADHREELEQHLTGFMPLANALAKGIPDYNIKRLIILELMGKARKKLLDRLIMRLGRLERLALQHKVYACSQYSKKR